MPNQPLPCKGCSGRTRCVVCGHWPKTLTEKMPRPALSRFWRDWLDWILRCSCGTLDIGGHVCPEDTL